MLKALEKRKGKIEMNDIKPLEKWRGEIDWLRMVHHWERFENDEKMWNECLIGLPFLKPFI